jgi:hypothetical protein
VIVPQREKQKDERTVTVNTFPKYGYCDQMKEDGMGGTCSIHGEMKNAHSILSGTLKARDNFGILDERIILIRIFRNRV